MASQMTRKELVTDKTLSGSITNSGLELSRDIVQKEAVVQYFDVRESTILSKINNLNTLFWSRMGLATTATVPAHLLRLWDIHQIFHRYVPQHDYLPEKLTSLMMNHLDCLVSPINNSLTILTLYTHRINLISFGPHRHA